MQHHARTLISTGIAAAFMATAALAHHGWSWAEVDQIELTGTVKKVVIAPPHPTIDLTATDGVDWHIELGNPGNTARSGFNEPAGASPPHPDHGLSPRARCPPGHRCGRRAGS